MTDQEIFGMFWKEAHRRQREGLITPHDMVIAVPRDLPAWLVRNASPQGLRREHDDDCPHPSL